MHMAHKKATWTAEFILVCNAPVVLVVRATIVPNFLLKRSPGRRITIDTLS